MNNSYQYDTWTRQELIDHCYLISDAYHQLANEIMVSRAKEAKRRKIVKFFENYKPKGGSMKWIILLSILFLPACTAHVSNSPGITPVFKPRGMCYDTTR